MQIQSLKKKVYYKAFVSNKTALFGVIIMMLIILCAVFATVIAPHDPTEQDVINKLAKPSFSHPLGLDQYGRDILSRIIYGSRISLLVGISSVLIGILFGVSLGIIAGYWGGFIDLIICKLIDILMSFPMLLLAIAIVSILGTSLFNAVLAVGIASIPRFARLARGQVLYVKNFEYVEAARAMGANSFRIIIFHLLANIISPVMVMGTVYIATAIIMESTLSFLGLGVQPPMPSWGTMISESRSFLRTAPWFSLYPGIAIALCVLSINMIGDGLRDALDPKLRR